MSNINISIDDIRKAFIKPDGNLKIGVVVPTDSTGRVINEKNNIDRGVAPHQTMKRAFKNLLPHALNLLRMVPKGSVYDETYIKNRSIVNDTEVRDFEVVGFEVKGSDDEPEYAITVRKTAFNYKHVDIKTPFVKIYGNKVLYPFAALLAGDLDDANEEVHEYICGKYYDSDQLSIDSSEQTELDLDEEDEVQDVEFEDEDETF